MIRIAVCDDLPAERKGLISMLRKYCAANDLNAEYDEFDCGEELIAVFQPETYSLLFLDIYMAGMTGMETARKLKKADPNCLIIFTTTSLEHGAEAFDVEAFHYLVKPVDQNKLFSVMSKWFKELCEIKMIELKCKRSIKKVFVRDILYIDVQGRNCTVHTMAESIEAAVPLNSLEELLPAHEFFRPIRYCLVSMRHVQTVLDDTILLDSGETLAISRREKENLRQQLAAYRLKALRRR